MYRFNVQTCVYNGRGCIAQYGEQTFQEMGKRACIVTSVFQNGKVNRALEDIKKLFGQMGIEYLVIDGIEENPSVENVAGFRDEAEAFRPDFMVGIGGGSPMDASKALGMLIENPGVEPYEVFYSAGAPLDNYKTPLKMPLVCIPTTAGTGSEITGGAVLTRADIDTKEAMYMWVYATVSFVDPAYLEGSPLFLIDTGVTDALAHGIEGYLSKKANPVSRSLAMTGFDYFSKFKDSLLKGSFSDVDYDNISQAAFIQGISFMQSSTTIPHGMSYPLSHLKGVNHGLSCSLFLGEYVRSFRDQSLVQPIVRGCGFNSTDEFADYIREVTNRNVDIEVTDEELRKWSDDFMTLESYKWRLNVSLEPVTWDMIYSIYSKSLKKYVK